MAAIDQICGELKALDKEFDRIQEALHRERSYILESRTKVQEIFGGQEAEGELISRMSAAVAAIEEADNAIVGLQFDLQSFILKISG